MTEENGQKHAEETKDRQKYPNGSEVRYHNRMCTVQSMSLDSKALLPGQENRGPDFNLYTIVRTQNGFEISAYAWQYELDAENQFALVEPYAVITLACPVCSATLAGPDDSAMISIDSWKRVARTMKCGLCGATVARPEKNPFDDLLHAEDESEEEIPNA